MKTKQLTPREAMELFLLTRKPLPLRYGNKLDAVSINSALPFYILGNPYSWSVTAEIEIPEGRNPDGLTLAHLQMGENGHEYRLLEEYEFSQEPNDDVEFWFDGEWIKGCKWLGDSTHRTRKPKGYYLPKQQEPEQPKPTHPDNYNDTPETRKALMGAWVKTSDGEIQITAVQRGGINGFGLMCFWHKSSTHKISFDRGETWHDWGYLPKQEVQSE
jgi:hypothetical protein